MNSSRADTPLASDAELKGLYPIEQDILDAISAVAPNMASRLRERLPEAQTFDERNSLLREEFGRVAQDIIDLANAGLGVTSEIGARLVTDRLVFLTNRLKVFYGELDGTERARYGGSNALMRPVYGARFDPGALTPAQKVFLGIPLTAEEKRISGMDDLPLQFKIGLHIPLTPEEAEQLQAERGNEKATRTKPAPVRPDSLPNPRTPQEKPSLGTVTGDALRDSPAASSGGASPTTPEGENIWEQQAHLFKGFRVKMRTEGDQVTGTLETIPDLSASAETAMARQTWGLKEGRVFFVGTRNGNTIRGQTRFGLVWMNRPECAAIRDRAETDRTHWSPFALEQRGETLVGGFDRMTLLTGGGQSCDIREMPQGGDQFELVSVAETPRVVSVVFATADEPFLPLQAVPLETAFTVAVTYDIAPGLDEVPVSVANSITGEKVQVTAMATEDPLLFRTSRIELAARPPNLQVLSK